MPVIPDMGKEVLFYDEKEDRGAADLHFVRRTAVRGGLRLDLRPGRGGGGRKTRAAPGGVQARSGLSLEKSNPRKKQMKKSGHPAGFFSDC